MGTLYYGNNLDILRRYLKDESVDLVYLDPPFNSAQNYNAFFHEKDGTDPLASHGHNKSDAQRIRALVEEAQGTLNGPERLKLS
jgi:16S rRNA G966 N2-methylase RsmD